MPDFDEVKARRAARSTEEGVPERSDKKLAGAPASPEEEAPVERVVKLIGAILNPPVAPEKARASDDFFDKGLGLLVKKSVYACCVLLVLWEVYLSSTAFDRNAPMISVEEALVGYPVPAKTVMWMNGERRKLPWIIQCTSDFGEATALRIAGSILDFLNGS